MHLGGAVSKGNTAKIYIVDGKAVKLFEERFGQEEAVYEANKQRHVFACGLAVPEVLETATINGRPAIVMEYIPGPTFGELMQRDCAQVKALLACSIDLQMQVHSKSISGFEHLKDRLQQRIQKVQTLESAMRSRLLEKLEVLPDGKHLCHGDFHIFNLIRTAGRDVIIDWVDASMGNPLADVCRSYLLYTEFSEELACSYLHLYCEKSGTASCDILTWVPVVAAARLAENTQPEAADRLFNMINASL